MSETPCRDIRNESADTRPASVGWTSPAFASPASKESGVEKTGGSQGGQSGGKRRRKKREQMPEGFEQWTEEDQKYYKEVSALLRDAKATKRQCSMKREHPSPWHMFRMKSRSHPNYPVEMEAYKRAKEIFKPIDKGDQLDLDF